MQAVPVNYWAILVCGVASMVLGFIWYGPLFGKMYIKMMGLDRRSAVEQEEMKKGMTRSYVLSFLGSLVMAWVLAHAIIFAHTYMGASSSWVSVGLITGLMSWLGFVATVTMGEVLWGTKSWKLWMLGNGYNLLQLLIFGVILGLWK